MPYKVLCICIAYFALLSLDIGYCCETSTVAVHTRRALHFYFAGIDKRNSIVSADFAL